MAQDTLDRLEAAWKDLDRRVAAHDEDLVHIQRVTRLRSVRRHLWPFAAGQGLQLVAGLALMVPAVAVETDPGSTMVELASAIVLHVYAVAAIAWAMGTLVLIGRLDPGLPVFEMQERLLRLRRTYLTGSFALGLAWWVLWLPFLTMLAAWRGAHGYMDHLSPAVPWMIGVSLAGFLTTLVVTFLARSRPKLRDRLLKLLSGGQLLKAEKELQEIVEIRREQT